MEQREQTKVNNKLMLKMDKERNEKINEDKLILSIQILEKQLLKYKQAYHRLMMEFNELPDEVKEKLDKDLKELGL